MTNPRLPDQDEIRDPQSDLLDEPIPAEAGGVPQPELRDTILGSVATETRFEGFVPRVARFLDLSPEAARELLRRADSPDAEEWRSEIAGTRTLHFRGGPRHADRHCGLIRVDPGTHFPRHRHRGDEWALVLWGSAREDTGRLWEPGDLIYNAGGSGHAFEVLGSEPFVFVTVLADWIEFEHSDSD